MPSFVVCTFADNQHTYHWLSFNADRVGKRVDGLHGWSVHPPDAASLPSGNLHLEGWRGRVASRECLSQYSTQSPVNLAFFLPGWGTPNQRRC